MGVAGQANLQEFIMFKSNVGSIDRILRVVLGIALIALTLTGTIGVWGWLGVVPLLTAALGSCPVYTMLGLSTCPMKRT
jgi:O-antigen ligase